MNNQSLASGIFFGTAALGSLYLQAAGSKTPQKKSPPKCVRIDDSVECGLISVEDLVKNSIDKALQENRVFLDTDVMSSEQDKSVLHMLRSTLKSQQIVLQSCKLGLCSGINEINATEDTLSSMKEKVSSLESELRLLSSREHTLAKLAHTCKADSIASQENVTSLESEIRLLRSSILSLEKSRDRAADDAKSYKTSLDKSEEKYMQRERELEKSNTSCNIASQEIVRLQCDLQLTSENLLNSQAQLKAATTHIANLQLCIEGEASSVDETSKADAAKFTGLELSELRDVLEAYKEQLEKSNISLEKCEENLTRTREELSIVLQRNARLKSENESLNNERNENVVLRNRLAVMKDEGDLANNHLESLKASEKLLQYELEALRSSLIDRKSEYEAALNDLSAKLSSSEVAGVETITCLKNDLLLGERDRLELTHELSATRERILANQSELELLKSDLLASREEVELMSTSLGASREEAAVLQTRLQDEVDLSLAKNSEIDLLHVKVADLLKSQEEMSCSEEALVEHASTMHHALTDTHSELDKIRSENAELTEQLQATLSEVAALRHENESLPSIQDELAVCKKQMHDLQRNTADLLNEELTKSSKLEKMHHELHESLASNLACIEQVRTDLQISENNYIDCRHQLDEKHTELASILLHFAQNEERARSLELDVQYKAKIVELDSVEMDRLQKEITSLKESHLADIEDIQSQVQLFKQDEPSKVRVLPLAEETDQYELLRCKVELNEVKRINQDLRHQLVICSPLKEAIVTGSTASSEASHLVVENSSLKELLAIRDTDLHKAKEILEIGGNSIAHLRGELAKLKKHYKSLKNEKTASIMKISNLEAELGELRLSTHTLHHDKGKLADVDVNNASFFSTTAAVASPKKVLDSGHLDDENRHPKIATEMQEAPKIQVEGGWW